MRTIDDMVRQEVIYCVSTLVDDVAKLEANTADWLHLFSQYEECERCKGHGAAPESDPELEALDCPHCEGEGEIYHEVFEHWIVSNWLADKLEAYGEVIERDFHGLVIWGRTTTGQSISMDYVIQRIYDDACKHVAAL